ncbi:type II toxin-antitoxin system death-on-curing family toxin [Domibacillus indicus]|uniref:type II toxin-antitoxin system death-on-curing family toxin n=1 Tax=Domibacillus indicus TaxID=1437523 RepID=UPI00203DEE43|nr:type II toxin-antitoxin system death-on-curing family toxin [Domibacillus indicus]MCM3790394.1 type II toxin-antitoxin system death-on-curing family toxin [Domibacillus indicus]
MIKFLTHKQVIFLNGVVIKRYSPDEMIGVKDEKMLDSALMRPQSSAFGEDAYPSLTEKAAALYASLAQNHAFQNANKRTAFACLHQFLWINGYRLQIPEKEAEDYTVYVVNEKPPIQLISDWISEHISKKNNG